MITFKRVRFRVAMAPVFALLHPGALGALLEIKGDGPGSEKEE
jgi:hypothetical protein